MIEIICGDALTELQKMQSDSVHCVVTSPPYFGLRDYGVEGQIGLEPTPEEYVLKMVEIFEEVRRVLRSDGTTWLNLGDSYAGNGGRCPGNAITLHLGEGRGGKKYIETKRPPMTLPDLLKPKDLIGIPWMVAFALRSSGWYLRSDIIWHKPNAMPESVTDRPTRAHEHLFLLSKNEQYYYDSESIKEKSLDPTNYRPAARGFDGKNEGKAGYSFRATSETRNKRSVWSISTEKYPEAHFATYPPQFNHSVHQGRVS